VTVEVVEADGTLADFAPADAIYVNAGVTHPSPHWLDRQRDGGRLVLPMTALRTPEVPDGPSWTGVQVAIFPCEGARDPLAEQALAEALEAGGAERVRHLHRHKRVADERCWLSGDG